MANTEQPYCCFIDFEGGRCTFDEDLFEVRYSSDLEDYTQVCRVHLGDLIDVGNEEKPWQSSTVTAVSRTLSPKPEQS